MKIFKAKTLFKTIGYSFILFFVSIILFLLSLTGFYMYVKYNPGDFVTENNVKSILFDETLVYYNDEKTILGTLVSSGGEKEQLHREYVDFDEIPNFCVDALVSAEDKGFWSHYIGIDGLGFLRAVINNMKMAVFTILKKVGLPVKRVGLQGASTLEMQLIEILRRPNNITFADKIVSKVFEYLDTIRLHAYYTTKYGEVDGRKRILEFYFNQMPLPNTFIGIKNAAKYYFGVEVSKLNLYQCAFIAASMKAPAIMNPFKENQKRITAAKNRSLTRTQYVLDRMYEDNKISEKIYEKGIKKLKDKKGLNFNLGITPFQANTTIDLVRHDLIRAADRLTLLNINPDKIAYEGLKVITTLDPNVQKKSIYFNRKTVSKFVTVLNGYTPLNKGKSEVVNKPELYSFYIGTVQSYNEKNLSVKVKFGPTYGILNKKSIANMTKWHIKGKLGKNRIKRVNETSILNFIKEFLLPGSRVLCSIKNFSKKGQIELDLESMPQITDGVHNIQAAGLFFNRDGGIITHTGSYDNFGLDFSGLDYYLYPTNRNKVLRQPGSAFKVIIQAVALDLGWKPTDLIWNRPYPFYKLQYNPLLSYKRNPLKDKKSVYFPKNDHKPKHEDGTVTLWSALVHSENIAHVWLLYHLLDHADSNELKTIAELTKFKRNENEEQKTRKIDKDKYIKRLDKEGIIYNSANRNWAAFIQAKHSILENKEGEYNEQEKKLVDFMEYGFFNEELIGFLNNKLKSKYVRDKHGISMSIKKLEFNYKRFSKLLSKFDDNKSKIMKWISDGTVTLSQILVNEFGLINEENDDLDSDLNNSDLKVVNDINNSHEDNLIFPFKKNHTKNAKPLNVNYFHENIWALSMAVSELDEILENTYIDGVIKVSTLRKIKKAVENSEIFTEERVSLYDNYLIYHPVARLRIALKYIQLKAAEFGVKIDKGNLVPSLPLGIQPVSPIDILKAYSSIIKGYYPNFHIIKRIEDKEGNIVFKNKPDITRVNIKEHTRYAIAQMLTGVAISGTAKKLSQFSFKLNVDGDASFILKGTLKAKILGDEKYNNPESDNNNDAETQNIEDVETRYPKEVFLPVGGKTGTTNKNVDSWFIGYFADLSYCNNNDDSIKEKNTDNINPMELKSFISTDDLYQLEDVIMGFTWSGEYKQNRFGAMVNKKLVTPKRVRFTSGVPKIYGSDMVNMWKNIANEIKLSKKIDEHLLSAVFYRPTFMPVAPSKNYTTVYIHPNTGKQATSDECEAMEYFCLYKDENDNPKKALPLVPIYIKEKNTEE